MSVTSAIFATGTRWGDNGTICACRQVAADRCRDAGCRLPLLITGPAQAEPCRLNHLAASAAK